jgi:hypothetical protein
MNKLIQWLFSRHAQKQTIFADSWCAVTMIDDYILSVYADANQAMLALMQDHPEYYTAKQCTDFHKAARL